MITNALAHGKIIDTLQLRQIQWHGRRAHEQEEIRNQKQLAVALRFEFSQRGRAQRAMDRLEGRSYPCLSMFLEANLPGAPRGCPFRVDRTYRVLQEAPSYSGTGQLIMGEILKFVGSSYGTYDGVSVYVFTGESGEEKTWALHDDESLDSWTDIFTGVAKMKRDGKVLFYDVRH